MDQNMDPQSGFPRFEDGDVCIFVSPSRIYQLHSNTLRRLSPVFAKELDKFPAAKLTAAAKREGATAYRFELIKSSTDKCGHFIRIRMAENGRPQYESPQRGNYVDETDIRLWDWLFGSFYHIRPQFEDYNLAVLLRDCMDLVDLADSIGSMVYVCQIVDHALLNQDQKLWVSIAANPTAWTELGCRIRSERIFGEGIIHLVGQWQNMTPKNISDLRAEIRDLCEKKHQELYHAKRAVDLRVLGHYPPFLHRRHLDKPDRSSYSSDIYMWMAISFYRHYYGQAIAEHRARDADDGGYKFYSAIGKGGDTYLNHEDFRAFHQYFPMSGKACKVLESNMNVLKAEMQPMVKNLLTSRTQLKPGGHDITWLTCIEIDKSDLPWETEQQSVGAQYLPEIMGYDDESEDEEEEGIDMDMHMQMSMPSSNSGYDQTSSQTLAETTEY